MRNGGHVKGDDWRHLRLSQLSFNLAPSLFQRVQTILNCGSAQDAVGDLVYQALGAALHFRKLTLQF